MPYTGHPLRLQQKIWIVQADKFIQNIEVVNMSRVIIVRPDVTKEQRYNALKNVANIIEKIILEEYGVNTKVTFTNKTN